MLILTLIIALVAIIVAALAFVTQHHRMEKTAARQEAWERTQQSQLRIWETQLERRITDLETKLTAQLQETQEAWQQWETKDAARLEELAQEYKTATTQLRLEQELARILRIEDTPLSTDAHGQNRPSIANWRPLMFYQADLRKRDLSHRYLGHADLREAQLAGTTLFMANLSGANLSGADLSNADLSGADLSGADLRGAILAGANLLVADLHNAILTGANLLGVRSLTAHQLHSATYDSSTLLDAEIDATPVPVYVEEVHKGLGDMTLPRMETVHAPAPSLPATPIPVSVEESTPTTAQEEIPVPVAMLEQEEIPVPVAVPEPEPESESESEPEPDAQPEMLSSPLAPDTTSFIQHPAEPAPASSLTSGDSLLDPKVADLLVDRQESKRTGGSGTATPRRRHNGKRATKQD